VFTHLYVGHTQAADAQSTYCFATRAAALTNAWFAVQDVLLVPVALVALLPPFTVRAVAHFAAVVAADADAEADAPDSFYCEPLRAAVVFQVCKCRRCERAMRALVYPRMAQSFSSTLNTPLVVVVMVVVVVGGGGGGGGCFSRFQ
jgi:hypothetical protein